jgi:hypothetical protein
MSSTRETTETRRRPNPALQERADPLAGAGLRLTMPTLTEQATATQLGGYVRLALQEGNGAHYSAGGIETIEFIKAKLGPVGYVFFLRGKVLEYCSKAGKADDLLEDLEKASWYLDRCINELRGEG